MNSENAQAFVSFEEALLSTQPEVPTADQVVASYESAPPAAQARMLSELVGEVYESAPLTTRGILLEKLLRPVGAIALVSIAGGIFAKIRFRHGMQDAPLKLEDVRNVSTADVLALVDRVQQASGSAMQSLGNVIASSPVLASSAAASALLMVLIKSGRAKRLDDFDA